MKKIVYSLFSLLLFALSGCVQDTLVQPDAQAPEGGEVTVRFSTTIPEYTTVQTRANGGVNDMQVLVFDQNGTFIVRKPAALTAQTETGGTFTATLPSSANRRYVHFICNYDWSTFNDDAMLGSNEAAVVALLSTTNATFWARKALTGGINANSFTGNPVTLLRNQAKISVTNEAGNFTLAGFTIHKASAKGTVAPFNTATGQFEEHAVTEPVGLTLTNALSSGISTTEKYLFERKNKNASEITTVIVKGTYNGTVYYYKIDLIDANKVRYNIERNYHYQVKIKTVTKAGYTNFTDALNGASHNNTALDPIIEKYPMISDGTSKLEVEKTLVVFTQPGQALNVWAKYYPDINSTTVNNTGVTATLSQNDGAIAPGSLAFNPTTGIITATAASVLPAQPAEARIVVTKGDLARTIRVVMRTPFSFNPIRINDLNPALLTYGQNVPATLRFTIPADFPADLLPLPIKIYTQGLYPAAAGLQMIVEQGVIHYVYSATGTGLQTVQFKTNKSGNAETVTLKADYFADGTVAYNSAPPPPPINISGTIRYQPDPASGNTTAVPASSITVTGIGTGTYSNTSGNYTLSNIPGNTPGNTVITFTYVRSWLNNNSGTYTASRTLDQLRSNPNVVVTR